MVDEYNHIIASVGELKYFFDEVLKPLGPTEVFFLSLSARNKYLSEEKRDYYHLGRSEMFAKSIVREYSWERFLRTIRRFECHREGYLTQNGLPIPSEALVCYININPSETLKVIREFDRILSEYTFELLNTAVAGRDRENILNRLNKIDNNLLTAYQKSTGTKHWIDFDMDVDKRWKPFESVRIKAFLASKDIGDSEAVWVDTKSGYHLMIARDKLKFNPADLVAELAESYRFWLKESVSEDKAHELWESREIIVNKNQMIPLPGTFQGNHIVTVLNKHQGSLCTS
jgi:hypothetical protein